MRTSPCRPQQHHRILQLTLGRRGSSNNNSGPEAHAHAHPSGLPSSPLLSRPLQRNANANANHGGSGLPGFTSPSMQHQDQRSPSMVSPSTPRSGGGEGFAGEMLRSPVRGPSSSIGMGTAPMAMASSPTRNARHVTASQQQQQLPAPRTSHASPLQHHQHQQHPSYQHQQHQHQQHQQAMHRPPITSGYREPPPPPSRSSSDAGAGGGAGTERRTSEHPHHAAMSDRRTSLPFLPPLPPSSASAVKGRPGTHAAAFLPPVGEDASSQRASFHPPLLPPPPPSQSALDDAEQSHSRQVSSLSPRAPPTHTHTPAQVAEVKAEGRTVLPPLSPSIRTRSLSHSYGAPPSLPPPSSTTSTTSIPYPAQEQIMRHGTPSSLPSPPKTGGSLAGGGLRQPSRPAFSPPPPPSSGQSTGMGVGDGGEGAYRLPPPSFPAQALFDDPRYHRSATPSSTAGTTMHGHYRSQSVPFGAHDVEMPEARTVSPASPRAPPSSYAFPSRPPLPRSSSNERPPSRLSGVGVGVGGGTPAAHPQLSSRTLPQHQQHQQQTFHSKNSVAQTLRAAAEDRLRLDLPLHSPIQHAVDYANTALARTTNGVCTPPSTPDVNASAPGPYASRRSGFRRRSTERSFNVVVDAVVSPLTSPPPSPPPVLLPLIGANAASAVSAPAPVLSPVQFLARVY